LASPRVTLRNLRTQYHERILAGILGQPPRPRGASNGGSATCVRKHVAAYILEQLERRSGLNPPRECLSGEGAEDKFLRFTEEFIEQAFRRLEHLWPGPWTFTTLHSTRPVPCYYACDHITKLQNALKRNPKLRSTIRSRHFITPDITISRTPLSDAEINRRHAFVGHSRPEASYTPLRLSVNKTSILHASISCKWTIRSDRAQNTRTEALNLIRNRKGKVPIVVAVTFESLPTRIASIALGTADLDCTYHGALLELREAVEETGNEDQKDMLNTLVDGRRLRDITDLPFDLAI